MNTTIKTTIVDIKNIADDVYVISFPRPYSFRAGQVIAIDLEEKTEPRLYSIASGEQDENIDILFDKKLEGKLTPHLSKLEVGDSIWISEPFGDFTCNDVNAWFIASGTGVAPFVSMIRSGMSEGKRLIHGGRKDENFYFSNLLENYLSDDNYIRCASQEEKSQYYKGRLTSWLKEITVLPKEIKYYLCGSAEMVVDVRDILIARGVAFDHIVSETYF